MGEVLKFRKRPEQMDEMDKLLHDLEESENMHEIHRHIANYIGEDMVVDSQKTYVRGYWGYMQTRRFALLPIFTEDLGWIWLSLYYQFKTAMSYDRHGWDWQVQGRSVTLSKMKEIQKRFFGRSHGRAHY